VADDHPDSSDDPTGGDLERWIAEARAREAVEERVRERWLHTQALESSALAGILVALAETLVPVVVTTVTGRNHTGRVLMVGADFVLVRRGNERSAVIALSALATISPKNDTGRRARPIAGERRPSPTSLVRLADVFATAVGDRPRLMIYAGEARTTGQLVAVGVDFVTVRTDGQPPGLAYVQGASVSEVSLLDSG